MSAQLSTADHAVLEAFRALGTDIMELRSAVYVMEEVDHSVMSHEAGEKLFRGPPGFRVYALNKDEDAARIYILHHVGDLARKLMDRWDEIEGVNE